MSMFGTLGLYYRKGNGRIAVVPVPISLYAGVQYYPDLAASSATNAVPITMSIGGSEVMQGGGAPINSVPITMSIGGSEVMQGGGAPINSVPVALGSTTPVYNYSITPSTSTIYEGSGTVVFSVVAANSPDNTVLYWSVSTASTVVAADFTEAVTTGSVVITGQSASFSLTPVADNTPDIAASYYVGATSAPYGDWWGANFLWNAVEVGGNNYYFVMRTPNDYGANWSPAINALLAAPAGSILKIRYAQLATVSQIKPEYTMGKYLGGLYQTGGDWVCQVDSSYGVMGGLSSGASSNWYASELTILNGGTELLSINLRSGSATGPILVTSSVVNIIDV